MKWLIFLILLSGCYSMRKAKTQFAKASIAYPELPADYCARTYPPKDTIIKGKDSIRVDTLWGEATVVRDTIRNRDTVFINTVKYLPGQVINRTILRTDTVYQENRASLDLCGIERGRAIGLLEKKTAEYDKWRAIARKRFFIILGMGFVIALGLFGFIRKKLTNPLK